LNKFAIKTKNRLTSKKIYNWGLLYHEEENR
jgi:hypothetical protein